MWEIIEGEWTATRVRRSKFYSHQAPTVQPQPDPTPNPQFSGGCLGPVLQSTSVRGLPSGTLKFDTNRINEIMETASQGVGGAGSGWTPKSTGTKFSLSDPAALSNEREPCEAN